MPLFQSTCPARGTTIPIFAQYSVVCNFNPRAPRGARLTIQPRVTGAVSYFNPRAPRGARPSPPIPGRRDISISIHVPREGHDMITRHHQQTSRDISIHVPREGHDHNYHQDSKRLPNFNPRAPRGARPKGFVVVSPASWISIHVPREGHDGCRLDYSREWANNFNPRAPRGARLNYAANGRCCVLFQSTCPARGTTIIFDIQARSVAISIHVPREGHDAGDITAPIAFFAISIHVPREGHDPR